MSKNNVLELHAFDREVGKIGFDEDRRVSFFQYHTDFLQDGHYRQLFPLVIRRIPQTQVFSQFNTNTFRGMPPMIADSLPDMFGNLIFKTWMEESNKTFANISVLEQLAYVGRRGMGALEYLPAKKIPENTTIDIKEITEVVRRVIENKKGTGGQALDHASLLNVFKIGTSAGGVRPKILVAEHKSTGAIIPGDLEYSDDYYHYLVKLDIEEEQGYCRELIEYAYYQTARLLNIGMMPSRLIDGKHFATERFDRQGGRKKHVLTATGISGMDFLDPSVSSYENLFKLAIHLKLPPGDIDQLFRRMVFNLVFANHDDHLKNHAFIYGEERDEWMLSPAYDLTYSLNPLLTFTRQSRALSINGKRMDLTIEDIKSIAEQYTVRNAIGIMKETQDAVDAWLEFAQALAIPRKITDSICRNFVQFH